MPTDVFTIGPVLSFRGIDSTGQWQVTALIGIANDEETPVMKLDGNACPPPLELHTHSKVRYLRYDLSCELANAERRLEYFVDGIPAKWHFTVPARGTAPRLAYVSCNGFSDPGAMRKLARPANAVWADLLCNHDKTLRPQTPPYLLDKEQLWHETQIHDNALQRFHLLLMGGDQLYFDSIWEEIKPLKNWVGLSRADQLAFKVNKTLEREIEDYYFSLYSKRWLPQSRRRWGDAESNLDGADAMARIPTLMMWDDHDIIDGWGSYSCEMQQCQLFQTLFYHARRAFWLFQMQHKVSELPPLSKIERSDVSSEDPQLKPIPWRQHYANDSFALPLLDDQPGFTSAYQLGPISLVVPDLRTERSRTQIMGFKTWEALQSWMNEIGGSNPRGAAQKCQHLLFMSSIPVAHPKLALAEELLDVFGRDHVLDSVADDLKDQWAHDDHEGERKRLIETLTRIAEEKMLRVSIVSGDVHVAAWGTIYRRDIPPTANWAQINQFTSSAVVHPSLVTIPERLYFYMLNGAAAKIQAIDVQLNVEMMLFPAHNRYIMPSRNWLAFELDTAASDKAGCKLWATWRCENAGGFSNHIQVVHPAR